MYDMCGVKNKFKKLSFLLIPQVFFISCSSISSIEKVNKNHIYWKNSKTNLDQDYFQYLGNSEINKDDRIGTLVIDKTENILQNPKNFRSSQEILMLNDVNKFGINNLYSSGSAQFSKEELRWIINNTSKNIIVVDLRQEPHGFVNNFPVTWTNANNWVNFGQLKNNILIDEAVRIQDISELKNIQIPTAKAFKSDTINTNNLVSLKIDSAEREDQVVKKINAKYYRITVADHFYPSDSNVDDFLKMIEELDENTWVHFHCRGGKGRTFTFLLMFDMIKNAKNVSYKDILLRQSQIFPEYQFFNKKSEKYTKLFQEREKFISEFYDFAKNYDSKSNMTWSQWKSLKN